MVLEFQDASAIVVDSLNKLSIGLGEYPRNADHGEFLLTKEKLFW